MILQVKKAVKKSQEEEGDKNDTIAEDDPNGFNDQPLDSKTVVSFAIQVRIRCVRCAKQTAMTLEVYINLSHTQTHSFTFVVSYLFYRRSSLPSFVCLPGAAA